MVPLVKPLVPMVMPMVPLALPMVPLGNPEQSLYLALDRDDPESNEAHGKHTTSYRKHMLSTVKCK